MFSLIITIISIALVAVLALATLYYGGSAFSKGNAEAEAAKILLQGQQILGAAELYKAEKGAWPVDLAKLVSDGYLKSIPVAEVGAVSDSFAVGQSWKTVADNRPVYVKETVLSAVCQGVNKKAYGIEGVLKQMRLELVAQCYGDDNTKLQAVFAKSTEELALAVATPNVGILLGTPVAGGVPVTLTGDAWQIPPTTGVVAIPGDPTGTGGTGGTGGPGGPGGTGGLGGTGGPGGTGTGGLPTRDISPLVTELRTQFVDTTSSSGTLTVSHKIISGSGLNRLKGEAANVSVAVKLPYAYAYYEYTEDNEMPNGTSVTALDSVALTSGYTSYGRNAVLAPWRWPYGAGPARYIVTDQDSGNRVLSLDLPLPYGGQITLDWCVTWNMAGAVGDVIGGVAVAGKCPAPPSFNVSGSELLFNVNTGMANSGPLYVTNTGQDVLRPVFSTTSAGFSLSDGDCAYGVQPGQTCTSYVAYSAPAGLTSSSVATGQVTVTAGTLAKTVSATADVLGSCPLSRYYLPTNELNPWSNVQYYNVQEHTGPWNYVNTTAHSRFLDDTSDSGYGPITGRALLLRNNPEFEQCGPEYCSKWVKTADYTMGTLVDRYEFYNKYVSDAQYTPSGVFSGAMRLVSATNCPALSVNGPPSLPVSSPGTGSVIFKGQQSIFVKQSPVDEIALRGTATRAESLTYNTFIGSNNNRAANVIASQISGACDIKSGNVGGPNGWVTSQLYLVCYNVNPTDYANFVGSGELALNFPLGIVSSSGL